MTIDTLTAHHVLEYPGGYTRSVGPVIGRFFTGLRDGRIEGVRLADGRVLVPPAEYDPTTSDAIAPDGDHWIPVGPAGRVQSYTWVSEPKPGKHPLSKPFAFALIRPDGADTALLHAVDCGTADAITVGARVAPRWRAERTGHITDIEAWVLLSDGEEPKAAPRARAGGGRAAGHRHRVGRSARVRAQRRRSRSTSYLRGLGEGKIVGGRAPSSEDVYAASRRHRPENG